VLRVGQFGASLGDGVCSRELCEVCECVCCVWDSLEQVWGSECATGGFEVCVCLCVFVCVLRVEQFGASLGDGVCSRELCGVCECV